MGRVKNLKQDGPSGGLQGHRGKSHARDRRDPAISLRTNENKSQLQGCILDGFERGKGRALFHSGLTTKLGFEVFKRKMKKAFLIFEVATISLIGLALIADGIFWALGGSHLTLSYSFWEAAKTYPLVSFALGMLCGHLVWQYNPDGEVR